MPASETEKESRVEPAFGVLASETENESRAEAAFGVFDSGHLQQAMNLRQHAQFEAALLCHGDVALQRLG